MNTKEEFNAKYKQRQNITFIWCAINVLFCLIHSYTNEIFLMNVLGVVEAVTSVIGIIVFILGTLGLKHMILQFVVDEDYDSLYQASHVNKEQSYVWIGITLFITWYMLQLTDTNWMFWIPAILNIMHILTNILFKFTLRKELEYIKHLSKGELHIIRTLRRKNKK